MTGEQGTRAEKRRGDGTRRDKTRQRVTEQEGTREEKTRGDGTRGDKRREEISCDTIPHTDKRSFRIHGSRGHFTRRQLTPRALNARVHFPIKKGVRVSELSELRDPGPPPGTRPGPPRSHPGRPKSTQEPPKTTQDVPRAAQEPRREPQGSPRGAQEPPGGSPEPPKTCKNYRKPMVLQGFVKC